MILVSLFQGSSGPMHLVSSDPLPLDAALSPAALVLPGLLTHWPIVFPDPADWSRQQQTMLCAKLSFSYSTDPIDLKGVVETWGKASGD